MTGNSNDRPPRRRLKVWQRLFLVVLLVALLLLSSTLFKDFRFLGSSGPAASADTSGWEEPVYAYVVADEGTLSVPFYNEALAEEAMCGRGTYVEMESWEPYVSENGTEYYHVFLNGQFGYIRARNISDDKTDILQETQVYVRTSVNLLLEPDGISIGHLARKGEPLHVVGYDYLRDDGEVNMYEVKLGTDIGWIRSDYVVMDYASSIENWTNDSGSYKNHVRRGDQYGGGDAADLDYWPHEKGDFSEDGNVMPASCYALYISPTTDLRSQLDRYLDMAEGTAVNTFVFTIYDGVDMAYDSDVVAGYGILDQYEIKNSTEDFLECVRRVQDAGYYTVARLTAFQDRILARNYPEWSITDLAGQPIEVNDSYWPSVYCRSVWELKVGMAIEAVETFGFNEVQFDYVRFPDYLINYEAHGNIDLKNEYSESKAQAVQRFLIYATDALHAHGAYVAADVFGETSNTYVAPYGQYWDAISTVVDVISGMPYPDHYNGYTKGGSYYRPSQHPYATLYDWAIHVADRQSECSSPAVVRTWIQTWDAPYYTYDTSAIQREVVGLYDANITGGFMPWYANGSLAVQDTLTDVLRYDYYSLYLEAKAEGVKLSEKMGIDTSE